MEILKDKYTITELSQYLNITDHALRYYEKEFNIKVPKDDRGRRYYTQEFASIMYQIKSMRDQGLEIKAIKKIFQSENTIMPEPITLDENSFSVIPLETSHSSSDITSIDIKKYIDEFKDEIKGCVSSEVSSAQENLSREIYKSKLELGACVENSIRKLESKMEKHFTEVDNSLIKWRQKNKKGVFNRLFGKMIRNN